MARMKTIAELRRELSARKKQLDKLQAQRDQVVKQLAAVDRKIAALEGGSVSAQPKRAKKAKKAAARKGGRPKRGRSLPDVLAKAMVGKGNVKVAEAAKLAVAAGYKSRSAQFGNIVSQALSSDSRFRKVSRGIYALGKSGKTAAKKPAKPVVQKKGKSVAKPRKAVGALPQALAGAMAGKGPMGVKDAMGAVLAAGYKTKAKDFRFIVNKTLAAGGQFKKVRRGVYAVK